MSINAAQRCRTSAELLALRDSLPVTDEALAARLGVSVADLQELLRVDTFDPAGVWRVRDFLVAVAASKGIDVPEFSVIKDSRCTDAVGWFGTWDVPDVASL
ncbi:DUF2316 family protein [Actinomyces haliotis]|uniref:DUF2316 family protein n=1 Tax=Actinomyces haliotis TaxID=1280843 RepID=UPI00188DF260|nr:DUF2316 family protein [Actinomyces haliotis]